MMTHIPANNRHTPMSNIQNHDKVDSERKSFISESGEELQDDTD